MSEQLLEVLRAALAECLEEGFTPKQLHDEVEEAVSKDGEAYARAMER